MSSVASAGLNVCLKISSQEHSEGLTRLAREKAEWEAQKKSQMQAFQAQQEEQVGFCNLLLCVTYPVNLRLMIRETSSITSLHTFLRCSERIRT